MMKRTKKWIAFFIMILLLSNALGDVVLANNINNMDNSEIAASTSLNNGEFINDEYQVRWVLGGSWETGHNMTVSILNTGKETINNWQLSFNYTGQITQIWNAEVIDCNENRIVVKNDGWNKDIPVNGEITFGFACQEPFVAYPDDCKVYGGWMAEVDGNVEVTIDTSWDNGCKGSLIIYNYSDKSIEDWELEFDCNGFLETVWDGEIISNIDGHYIVKNAGYNYVIEPNSSAVVGFVLSGANCEKAFSNFVFKEIDNVDANDQDDDNPCDFVEEDLGEIYAKESNPSDIVTDDETGRRYVKNQILVSAYPGVDKAVIESIAAEIGAGIVGYIELTNDYQLEFISDKTSEEIKVLIDFVFLS